MCKPTGENSGHGSDKSEAAHSQKANWAAAESSNELAGSIKSEESQLVTVEDIYRRCLQGTEFRLGEVAYKRGSRGGQRRRIAGRSKRPTLRDRLRSR